jgi:hypothetical protein
MEYSGIIQNSTFISNITPMELLLPPLAIMTEVTYTDLNKYVILHMSKWVDPRSGEIHRVEYRWCRYLSPGVGRYLDMWQDGKVKSLTMRELQTLVKLWKNDSEHAVPQHVVDELINPTYEVKKYL